MKRVVLDTNIMVSMAMGGKLGKINDAWKTGKFLLIVSEEILSEYLEVFLRPRFHLRPRTVAVIIARVYRKAEFVSSQEQIANFQPDPKDDKFLEAAIAGNADFIVSGDKHLLNIKKFRSVQILTGREFLDVLEENG